MARRKDYSKPRHHNPNQNRDLWLNTFANHPDVAVKELKEDKKVVDFQVATNEVYKDKKGATQKNTTFHKCQAWGKTAEIAGKLLAKGKMVAIEGKLSNREYEDKDGIKRYITEIVVSEIMVLSKKED